MASPPVLPISNPQTITTNESQQPAIATPALRAFITRLTDSTRLAFSQRRPWSELIDRSAFTRPDSVSDAVSRARKNLSYFRINYLTILVTILAVSLLTNPLSLFFLLCLLASWIFLYLFRPADSPLVMFGRTFSDRETLGGLILISVVVIFLTNVGSVLISALMVGLAIVSTHGAFRVPEDLFLDDQETASSAASTTTGLLSFLGTASAAAPVVVATRV